MIFRRKGKDTSVDMPIVLEDTPPKIIVWHELTNARFFFEEDLLRDPQVNVLEALIPLQRELRGLGGVQQVRLYKHYIAISWLGDTYDEMLEQEVVPVLSRHFGWSQELELVYIFTDDNLRQIDEQYHDPTRKWLLGANKYL